MLSWPWAPRHAALPVGLTHLEGRQAVVMGREGCYGVTADVRQMPERVKMAATVFCLRVEVVSVTLAAGGSSMYHSGRMDSYRTLAARETFPSLPP